MLSQPTFGDRSLNESLYRALLNLFLNSMKISTKGLLDKCCFGIAPSPQGVKTFFIIAPYLQIADELIEDIDNLQERIIALMPGVGAIGICMHPPKTDGREEDEFNFPLYMICRLFELPAER